jgi:hypothetical protein
MNITPEMLQAATQKAIELGILPRRSQMEDFATNAELMQEILEAAFAHSDPARDDDPPARS